MSNRPQRGRHSLVTVFLLALLACLSSLARAGDTASPGTAAPIIDSLEIRMDSAPGKAVDLAPLVAFRPGEALSETAVRRTLSNLYATGLFREVEIRSRSEAEESIAVLILRSRPWVETVDIAGKPPGLRRATLRKQILQRPQVPLVDERIASSSEALQQACREHGYPLAQVSSEIVPLGEDNHLAVIFHIDSGPRARVGHVELDGNLDLLTAQRLLKVLRLSESDNYREGTLADDAERLRQYLRQQGYPGATVAAPQTLYDPERQVVDLRYEIDVGQRLSLEVSGFEEKKLRRKGLLAYLRERRFDQSLVEDTCERIETWLQRHGHYLAKVACVARPADREIAITIDVEPGDRYTLTHIELPGADSYTDDELRNLMKISTKQAWRRRSGRLVAADLEADLANLRSFYLLQGFSDVEVGPPRVAIDGRDLSVEIPIHEGDRRRVVAVSASGVDSLELDKLYQSLPIYRGGPYHPVLLEDSINVIRALYEEEGYASTVVRAELDWGRQERLVDVHFDIEEGPRHRIDRVLTSGQWTTRDDFVRNTISLRSGEPISRRRLLEVERDLYRLGIFSRVEVEPAATADADGRRDVRVRLEEGRRWRLGYGFSYHSDDGLGGLLSLSRTNLRGRGERLQLDLRGNQRDARFRLLYDQPSLAGTGLPITYSLFRQREKRESFTVDDFGTQVSVTHDFRSLRLGAVYDYRLVELSDEPLDLTGIDPEDRAVEISSLTPNLVVDNRDDPLDPKNGWSTSLQLEVAFPFLGADVELLKLFWQQVQYFDLGRLGVIAASLRLGAIEPFGDNAPDPLLPADLASSLVPASERFFAGGRTTHRAFSRDELGILGDSLLQLDSGVLFRAGGNGLVLINLDYRFPLGGNLGGVAFFDLGNVWADWRDIDGDGLEPGAGLGLRYSSPIGPVRLEVGWQLDRDFGDDGPVFFFSLGNPF